MAPSRKVFLVVGAVVAVAAVLAYLLLSPVSPLQPPAAASAGGNPFANVPEANPFSGARVAPNVTAENITPLKGANPFGYTNPFGGANESR